MKSNRDELFKIYNAGFNTCLFMEQKKNPSFSPNEEFIRESIKKTEEMLVNSFDGKKLSDEDLIYVLNKIKSTHSIHQDEGCVILGNYKHDKEWYNTLKNKEGYEEYYWDRYRDYLTYSKKYSSDVIEILDKDTSNILSYLGNPKEEETSFSFRGLVVGDVQSGKTSNYLGLISKAADAGYKIIFVLTGTIENLRKQTQVRIEEGFIGYDSTSANYVGVGWSIDKTPRAFTSRKTDFTGKNDQNTHSNVDNSSIPMIYIVKKNVSVLKKIYKSLKSINTSKPNEKINHSVLMIDDEADYASINTNKEENDPTKINEFIRKILALFTRNSYVGFTATPFANVFIKYDGAENENEMCNDDLFPKDFIYSLKTPDNYYGSKKYFFNKNSNVIYIKDYDDSIFPINHNKEWKGDRLFPSFYHSINIFLINNAIRDRRKDENTHRSMLINMSRFIAVQNVICGIVEDYFKNMKNAIYSTHKNFKDSMTNPLIKSLYDSFIKEYPNISISWEDLFSNYLYNAIKDIQIIVVNSKQNTSQLNYDDYSKGLRVIAIGGIALSRGLTLEGLNVSYFYRNTTTFDVLMQMGRWFGYRDGYNDLCKIFITNESAGYYKYIYHSIERLRDDIYIMGKQHKKPEEYGIRVLNDSRELNITAFNKSRYVSKKQVKKTYFGNFFETPYIYRDLNIVEQNINATFSLLNTIKLEQKDKSIPNPYFRDIPKFNIINFLRQISIHNANENFDTKQLIRFLGKNYEELNYFDVLLMKGRSNKLFKYESLNIDIPLVSRAYDIKENSVIRINAKRAHLMGRFDTKFGLSKEQQENIGNNARTQDYLIKERNPLLIVYFMELINENDNAEEDGYMPTTTKDDENMLNELKMRKYNYIVGYAICFPSNDKYNSKEEIYVVNNSVSYYDKEHEEEQGDDCNE